MPTPRRLLPIALCLAVASLFFARSAHAGSGGEWQGRASLNLARQETGGARVGGFVYVVGGLIASPLGATRTVEAYDIANDRWDFVAPMPVALDHMGVAAAGGKLYVAGGFSGDFVARDGAHVYDPSMNQWFPIRSMPEARGGCWAAEHGGKIYVFGGQDGSGITRNSTFVYDPGRDEWSSGRDMPTPRNHLVAVTAGEFIYVLGGRPPVRAVNERYDPVNDEWRTMAPMPTARSAMAVAAMNGQLIVAGGEVPMLHAVNEIYDIATNNWACADAMPIPRHGVAAVALDDRVLVPAGGLVQGFAPTAAADSFVPDPPLPPLEFLMKRGATEVASLTLERFAGRFFATVERMGVTRCADVRITIDGPGQANFPCGPVRVTLRRQGASLVWEARGASGTLCRVR